MIGKPLVTDRAIQIAFEQIQASTGPGLIARTLDLQLKPVDLSGNLDSYGNQVWKDWNDQHIRALGNQCCSVKDTGNRLNLILRGTNNKLWQAIEDEGPTWTKWHSPSNLSQQQNANIASFFAARFGRDGQIVLFCRGTDNSIWEFWSDRDGISQDIWTFKSRNVCTDRDIFAIERHYGGLEAFIIGLDNQIWHSWTMDYDHDDWSQWESLGGYGASGLYLLNNSEQYPELFVKDPNNKLWHIRHYRNGWHNWGELGGPLTGKVSATTNSEGGIDVYGIGFDRKLYRASRPGLDSDWQPWQCCGGAFSELAGAAQDANGSAKICAIGIDRRLWKYDSKTGFVDCGGCLASVHLNANQNGNVIAIGAAFDGNIFTRSI